MKFQSHQTSVKLPDMRVDQKNSKARVAQKILPPKEPVDLWTAPPEAKEELPGPRRDLSKASLLTKPVVEEWRGKTHMHWNQSRNAEKHLGLWNWRHKQRKLRICSGCKQTYVRVTNNLQMASNTGGGNDHLVERAWSWRLNWSAKMFFFPGMHLTDKVTECCSVQCTVLTLQKGNWLCRIVRSSRPEHLPLSLKRAHPGSTPGSEPFQGWHAAKQLLLHLCRSWEKKLVCQIPKFDNLSLFGNPSLGWCLSTS